MQHSHSLCSSALIVSFLDFAPLSLHPGHLCIHYLPILVPSTSSLIAPFPDFALLQPSTTLGTSHPREYTLLYLTSLLVRLCAFLVYMTNFQLVDSFFECLSSSLSIFCTLSIKCQRLPRRSLLSCRILPRLGLCWKERGDWIGW